MLNTNNSLHFNSTQTLQQRTPYYVIPRPLLCKARFAFYMNMNYYYCNYPCEYCNDENVQNPTKRLHILHTASYFHFSDLKMHYDLIH